MQFVGIDGCRIGWIAVAWDGATATAHHLPSLDALTAGVPAPAAIAIDMPTIVATPPRQAEIELRRALGPRRSSVFATPPPAAFEHEDYADANAAARATTGKGISRQSWALMPKIREVLEWIPVAPGPVIEAHPEACFAAMLGGPASASKKTWAGMSERLDALNDAGFDLSGLDEAAGRVAMTDDILDAAVAAWTARRFHTGTARRFPEDPSAGTDAIWA